MTDSAVYKGFNITFQKIGEVSRYFVEGEGFNPSGYITINAAKSAITKRLKATAENDGAIPEAEAHQMMTSLLPASEAVAVLDMFTKIYESKEFTLKAAHKAFAGVRRTERNDKLLSRNQREGRYAGKGKKFGDVNVKHWRTGPHRVWSDAALRKKASHVR